MSENLTKKISDPWAWITHLAFVIALSAVLGRAMVTDALRDPFDVSPGAQVTSAAPGPTTSLAFDLLFWVPAILILLRRMLDRTYVLRISASAILFIALGLLMMLSLKWSVGDRFATLIGASQFLASGLLMWAMVQLVRSWTRLRVVAGVCMGLLLAYVALGVMWRTLDVPDLRKYWEENRTRELAARGWQPDSFLARQFERKILGGEMIGFFTSPNTFAAVLTLTSLISIGVGIQRFAGKDPPGWGVAAFVVAAAGMGVLLYTGSRTGLATFGLGCAALIAWFIVRRWLSKRSLPSATSITPRQATRMYLVGVLGFLIASAGLVAHGLFHNTLFHDSLTFRWKYWKGAWQIFTDAPLLGVGWANFGFAYLGVRMPEASEEIKDPHNLIVRAATELGVLGFALMLAFLARLSWELSRPILPRLPGAVVGDARNNQGSATRASSPAPSTGSVHALLLLAVIAASGVIIGQLAGIDFSSAGSDLELLKRCLYGAMLFVGLCCAALTGATEIRPDDRASPWVLWTMIVAVGMFLIHNLIDFSLFEPGPMGLFALVAGAALGVRHPVGVGKRRRSSVAIGALVVACVAWIAGVIFILLPTATAESKARQADAWIRTNDAPRAYELLRAVSQSRPINADYAYRAARAAIFVEQMQGRSMANEVRNALAMALESNPMSVEYRLTWANYELSRPNPDLERAAKFFAEAVVLNPNDVSIRTDYAELLARSGKPNRAVEQYREALRLNDLLDPNEPKRLTDVEINKIKTQISQQGN